MQNKFMQNQSGPIRVYLCGTQCNVLHAQFACIVQGAKHLIPVIDISESHTQYGMLFFLVQDRNIGALSSRALDKFLYDNWQHLAVNAAKDWKATDSAVDDKPVASEGTAPVPPAFTYEPYSDEGMTSSERLTHWQAEDVRLSVLHRAYQFKYQL